MVEGCKKIIGSIEQELRLQNVFVSRSNGVGAVNDCTRFLLFLAKLVSSSPIQHHCLDADDIMVYTKSQELFKYIPLNDADE